MIKGDPRVDLGRRALDEHVELWPAHVEVADGVMIDDDHAIRTDGADGQFRLQGVSDLACHEHVEGQSQGLRDRGRDGDTASREAQHN